MARDRERPIEQPPGSAYPPAADPHPAAGSPRDDIRRSAGEADEDVEDDEEDDDDEDDLDLDEEEELDEDEEIEPEAGSW